MDFWWPAEDELLKAGMELWQRRGWVGEGPYPDEVERYMAQQPWFFSLHMFKGVMDWERWSRTGHTSPRPPRGYPDTARHEWF
ncbi:MAG: hypothetical protein BroJett018_16640 [Chloroflexota bacterium]|nr:MAG: hypothetical protein BroJett018_16640 [Chloroflexota bacterium]